MARTAPVAAAQSAPPVQTGARLAVNQLKRMRRIVDVAVDLAGGGGFEAVRLRDVANQSGVALGTLYKYFRSKEDLLLFALHEEIERLEADVCASPPSGPTALSRVVDLFRRATAELMRKPPFARAVVRAMAAGDPETAVRIADLQLRMQRLILAALAGTPVDPSAPLDTSRGNTREHQIALALIQVWFSAQIGWSVGLHPTETIVEHVANAARLMLKPGDPQ
jgi:AcrR family transcriptional regulator